MMIIVATRMMNSTLMQMIMMMHKVDDEDTLPTNDGHNSRSVSGVLHTYIVLLVEILHNHSHTHKILIERCATDIVLYDLRSGLV